MTIQRRRAGEEQFRLDRPPDSFRDALGPLELVPVNRYVVQDEIRHLVLVQDREAQTYRLAVREWLDQLVVEQELAGRIADVILVPRRPGALEVGDNEEAADGIDVVAFPEDDHLAVVAAAYVAYRRLCDRGIDPVRELVGSSFTDPMTRRPGWMSSWQP
jgi:hypothetical protein